MKKMIVSQNNKKVKCDISGCGNIAEYVIEYKRGMSSWIPPTKSIKTHRNQMPTAQTVTLDPNGITISHANVSTVINGDGISFFSKD